jgi:hypothetical protein
VVVFGLWAFADYSFLQRRLQAAAACNGEVSARQIEQMAEAGAVKSGLTTLEAEDAMIVLACPKMAR